MTTDSQSQRPISLPEKTLEKLGEDAPEVIENVRKTRLSVARFYGRVVAYGHTYVYQRESDSLIRLDVFRQSKLQPPPTRQ
jgi:hypothetical protein